MRDPDGQVLIEGFYEDVLPPTTSELSLLKTLPLDMEETAKVVGVNDLQMDSQTYYKKMSLEPTFTINGLTSGYSGEGQKTIIPSQASVKFDMRLVADQDPMDVFEKVKKHVVAYNPDIKINMLSEIYPSRTSIDHPLVQEVIASIKRSWNQEPIILPSIGATYPNHVFTHILEQPSMLVPYANDDENNHAPNENLEIDLVLKGIETMYRVINDLGESREL